MKRLILALLVMFVAMSGELSAQAFLQLDPQGFFREDLKLTPADWAGFYRTHRKEVMLIAPAPDGGITGFYTVNYYKGAVVNYKGRQVSRRGMEIGMLKGTLRGNGVDFSWKETVHGKKGASEEGDVGFMTMKEDREDVYLKQGAKKGALGNFTVGKKKAIEVPSDTANPALWVGAWRVDVWDESDLTLIQSGDGLVGFYTLKGYKKTNWYPTYTGLTKEKIEMPDRIVNMLCLPVGKKLYYISNNFVEDDIRVGVLELSPDGTSFSGQEGDGGKPGGTWKASFTGFRKPAEACPTSAMGFASPVRTIAILFRP